MALSSRIPKLKPFNDDNTCNCNEGDKTDIQPLWHDNYVGGLIRLTQIRPIYYDNYIGKVRLTASRSF